MKFRISSGDLVKGLGSVAGAVPGKATLPILEMVMFEAEDGVLRLTATDLEIYLVESVEADIEINGSVCIPAKRLLETLRQLPDIPVYFDVDDRHNVVFKTDKGTYKLVGQDSVEFPSLPNLEAATSISGDLKTIQNMISKSSFAVSTDDLRPAMLGAYFQVSPEGTLVVATDGHRLVKLIRSDITANSEASFIVPEKALNLVTKSFHGNQCDISVSEDHVMFKVDNSFLISRLINEKYPNYESVIPRDNDKILRVDKDELLSAVKRVSVFSSTSSRQIRMELKLNEILIQAEDIDMSSEAKESVTCEFEGEEMIIGFNAKYLGDVLNNADTDEVIFEFSTPNRAGIIKPIEEDAHQNMLMLVMPVMLNSYA